MGPDAEGAFLGDGTELGVFDAGVGVDLGTHQTAGVELHGLQLSIGAHDHVDEGDGGVQLVGVVGEAP